MALLYDILAAIFSFVTSIFFREVRARGTHYIPKYGPVIFVAAPHHNQFVDPLMLVRTCTRRVGFLAAQKTMDRKYVGKLAKAFGSIGVTRAQDIAKSGPGKICMPDVANAPQLIRGIGTRFTDLPKLLGVPSVIGCHLALKGDHNLEIAEIVSDTELKLKRAVDEDVVVQMLQAAEGTGYKVAPKVDHAKVYDKVYEQLRWGKCIGIFPEGGSHDRTELLPFKAGVTIMALGAMASTPGMDVKLVPVGLSYFNPDRFRSRAVVEYGPPITIPPELVEKYKAGGSAKRDACKALLETVEASVRNVTVTAPDFATMQVVQAVRRLYRPLNRKLTMVQKLELTRRLTKGYLHYRDDPRIKDLEAKVLHYNQLLKIYGLQDHQVERTAIGGFRALSLLLIRLVLLALMGALALPGTLVNVPIAYLATTISKQKAKEALAASTVKVEGRDVLATWKLIVMLVSIPVIYIGYTLLTWALLLLLGVQKPWTWLGPLLVFMGLPTMSLVALRYGEVGSDIYKSLPPLFFSVLPTRWSSSQNLRQVRWQLARDLNEVINELGPTLFPDFQTFFLKDTEIPRIKSQEMGLRRVSSWVTGFLTTSESFLRWDWDLANNDTDGGAASGKRRGDDEDDGVFNFSQHRSPTTPSAAPTAPTMESTAPTTFSGPRPPLPPSPTSASAPAFASTSTAPVKSEVDLTRFFVSSPLAPGDTAGHLTSPTASSTNLASPSSSSAAVSTPAKEHAEKTKAKSSDNEEEDDDDEDDGIVVIKAGEVDKSAATAGTLRQRDAVHATTDDATTTTAPVDQHQE
ncbi:Glycerol-3-phosphate/dihydroxyacetone phosphate acyltransferase [Sorochytrium milnesiophthora]